METIKKVEEIEISQKELKIPEVPIIRKSVIESLIQELRNPSIILHVKITNMCRVCNEEWENKYQDLMCPYCGSTYLSHCVDISPVRI